MSSFVRRIQRSVKRSPAVHFNGRGSKLGVHETRKRKRNVARALRKSKPNKLWLAKIAARQLAAQEEIQA